MVENNDFVFNIKANSQEARNTIEDLKSQAQELEDAEMEMGQMNDFSQIDTASINEYINTMNEFTKSINQLQVDLKKEFRQANRGAQDPETRRRAQEQYAQSRQQTDQFQQQRQEKFTENIGRRTRDTGRTQMNEQPSRNYRTGPTDSERQYSQTKRVNSNLNSELNQTIRTIEQTMNSGYINAGQSRNMTSSIENFFSEYQGAGEDQMEGVLEGDWQPEEGSVRADAIQGMADASEEIERIQENMQNVQSEIGDSGASAEQRRLLDDYAEEMRQQQQILDKHSDVINTLDEAIERLAPLVEDLNRETAQGNISQKPDRDTIEGTLYERSNSIALAITGAIGYQMADRYGQGKKTNQAMRYESLSFGMRTGDYDFRGIRSDYGALGADLGYNGMDMMGYAEDVMSNLGYTGSENTQEMSRTLAEGERYSGVDAEALSSFMNSSMQIGTVSNADEAKAIQEGFVGGIKASGMQGREQEQIRALTGIQEGMSKGLDVTTDQLQDQMSMATVLSGTGRRSLQGENLEQFMTSFSSSISGSSMYSDQGFMLGAGQNPDFMGPNGMYNYINQTQEGLTPENFGSIADSVLSMSPSTESAAATLYNQFDLQGTDIEGINEALQLYQQGELSDEALDEVFAETQQQGEAQMGENEEQYQDSADKNALSREAHAEEMNRLLNDNVLIDTLNKFMDNVNQFGSGGAGQAAMVAGAAGLGTAVGGLISNIPWLALSGGIKGLTGGKGLGSILPKIFGGKGTGGTGGLKGLGQTIAGGGLWQGVKSLGGKALGGLKNAGGELWQGAKSLGGKALGGLKNAGQTVGGWFGLGGNSGTGSATTSTTPPPTSRGTGAGIPTGKGIKGSTKGGGALSKTAGKFGLGLDVVSGIYNTFTSENKLQAGTEEAGRVGGGWAGSALGAEIGLGLGPVGSAIGGTIGYIAGSGLGQKVLGGIGDFLFGTQEEATGENQQADMVSQMPEGDQVKVEGASQENPELSESGDFNTQERNQLYNQYIDQGMPHEQALNKATSDAKSTQQQTEKYNPQTESSDGKTNEEQSITNTRKEITTTTQENLAKESENLNFLEKLIGRIQNLLNQAKEQNGIVGDTSGLNGGGGTSSSGSGVGGELGNVGEGEFWTSSDLTKHDLGKTTDTLTASQLNDWINSNASEGSTMYNQGEAFMEAGRQSGLDPRYLVGHAAHETGWGSSQIAQEKGNFYGIGAFDASPYASAYDYDSNKAGIVEGAKWISENYYQGRDATTLQAMNEDYATDPGWADKIANTMAGSEKYTQPSSGDTNINTTVNVSSSGDAEEDGEVIATAVNDNIDTRFTREYTYA